VKNARMMADAHFFKSGGHSLPVSVSQFVFKMATCRKAEQITVVWAIKTCRQYIYFWCLVRIC